MAEQPAVSALIELHDVDSEADYWNRKKSMYRPYT